MTYSIQEGNSFPCIPGCIPPMHGRQNFMRVNWVNVANISRRHVCSASLHHPIPIRATDQSPVHGTCVWLRFLRFGVQKGNDLRESRHGVMDSTAHCCGWLCDRRLKNSERRISGSKVEYLGAFVTIGARRLHPDSWLGEGTHWS